MAGWSHSQVYDLPSGKFLWFANIDGTVTYGTFVIYGNDRSAVAAIAKRLELPYRRNQKGGWQIEAKALTIYEVRGAIAGWAQSKGLPVDPPPGGFDPPPPSEPLIVEVDPSVGSWMAPNYFVLPDGDGYELEEGGVDHIVFTTITTDSESSANKLAWELGVEDEAHEIPAEDDDDETPSSWEIVVPWPLKEAKERLVIWAAGGNKPLATLPQASSKTQDLNELGGKWVSPSFFELPNGEGFELDDMSDDDHEFVIFTTDDEDAALQFSFDLGLVADEVVMDDADEDSPTYWKIIAPWSMEYAKDRLGIWAYGWQKSQNRRPPAWSSRDDEVDAPNRYLKPAGPYSTTEFVGRSLFAGTAADEPGPDMEAPIMRFATEAEENARLGQTLPHNFDVGQPRYYEGHPASGRPHPAPVYKLANDVLYRFLALKNAVSKVDDSELGDEASFETDKELADLSAAIHSEAVERAKAEGVDFFAIAWPEHRGWRIKDISDPQIYAANPGAVKWAKEEVLDIPLPGLRENPTTEDLVLYHGGTRPYGVISLEHRATDEGEGKEKLPILRHTPAIWAKDERGDILGYAATKRGAGSDTAESQVYYLDAPNVEVATIESKRLPRVQANAVVKKLLRGDNPPDILRLRRQQGGEEFFIPENFEPGLVKVENPSTTNRRILPVVAMGNTALDKPSDNYCWVMQTQAADKVSELQEIVDSGGYVDAKLANMPAGAISNQRALTEAKDELQHWTDKCESTRPIAGLAEAKDALEKSRSLEHLHAGDLERLRNPNNKGFQSSNWIKEQERDLERQLAVERARGKYWAAYIQGLEKTPRGYRLKADLTPQELDLANAVYAGRNKPEMRQRRKRGKQDDRAPAGAGSLPGITIGAGA